MQRFIRRTSLLGTCTRWRLTVVVCVVFLLLLGFMQTYYHTVYTRQLKQTPLDIQMLQQSSLSKRGAHFVHILRQAYLQGKLNLEQVYSMTSDLRMIVSESNQNGTQLLRRLMASNPSATVVIIQVGNNPTHVGNFIESLLNMSYVKSTVLVFAMKNYNLDIQRLIKDSYLPAPVILLINPFCSQLHPLWFPGDDPEENCRHRKQEKRQSNLTNDTTDCKRVRNSWVTGKKITWAWSASKIHEVVRHFQNFRGSIVHFDDTDLISSDAFHYLQHIHRMRLSFCQNCAISLKSPWSHVQMSNTSQSALYIGDEISYNSVHVTVLRGGFLHGVSFSNEMWSSLRICAAEFCHTEDSSWRWSVESAMRKACWAGKGLILVPRATRLVPHIQDFLTPRNCNITDLHNERTAFPQHSEKVVTPSKLSDSTNTSQPFQSASSASCGHSSKTLHSVFFRKEFLFPQQLYAQNLEEELHDALRIEYDVPSQVSTKDNGWHDIRDKQLCHAIFLGLDTAMIMQALQTP